MNEDNNKDKVLYGLINEDLSKNKILYDSF